MSSAALPVFPRKHVWAFVPETLLRMFHLPVAYPLTLFLVVLGLTIFHPPDFHFFYLDRIGVILLAFVAMVRISVLRSPIPFSRSITLPLFGLMTFALLRGASVSNDVTWSVFAAKWLAPFVFFHVAAHVFDSRRSFEQFEKFSILVLGYLSFIAVAFLFEQRYLVYPRYILDDCIGYHADRARGPFLQAVANGVALNLLGLIALDAFRRKRLPGWMAALMGVALPLAILATKTRAVWFGFAASMAVLAFWSPSRRLRRYCRWLIGLAALLFIVAVSISSQGRFTDRLHEESPVDFRSAVYQAGAEMFAQRPILGWASAGMQAELSRQVSDFHQEEFYFHNTFLEVLVNYGLVGLALYLWLVVGLFRVGRVSSNHHLSENCILDAQFRKLWPFFLFVYFFNAMFVGMNYQFVNAFVFTVAGILVGDNLRGMAVRRG
jgi:O-antigen ligase